MNSVSPRLSSVITSSLSHLSTKLRHRAGRLIVFGLLVALWLAGCAPKPTMKEDLSGWRPADTLQVGHEDAFNFVHEVTIDKEGVAGAHRVSRLKPEVLSLAAPEQVKPLLVEPERKAPDKVHLLLQEWLQNKDPQEPVEVLVQLEDSFKVPRLPDLPSGVERDSAQGKRVMEARQEVIAQIRKIRQARQSGILERLTQGEGKEEMRAEALEHFWLANTVLVKLPLGAVKHLIDDKEVVYVQPRYAGEKPPQDSNANNDAADGRARVVSDPYFNLGLTSGWIGLLDTGVRRTHTMFNSPHRLGLVYDCVSGGADCNNTAAAGYNPNDDCWNHGTSSAGIISGNANAGADYRGVTAVTLDSLKVYPNSCGGLDSAATLRGFERAIEILDGVIVAEMQAAEGDQGSIAKAAESAFDAGAVIVAANGNFGPGDSTVRSPANAHKVIGVGAYDVQSLATNNSQGRGPTADNRIKPDIQAPTNTETASNASDTALQVFTGTSGATPYAAGAAALFRNWLRQFGTYDPGQINAFMILAGDKPYPFDNTQGADDLRMPVNGWAWWGKVAISDGSNANIAINVPAGIRQVDVALWWPQPSAWWEGLDFGIVQLPHLHNDIDLYLQNPDGTTVASSPSVPSIFEKVQYTGSVSSGNWTVRIHGYKVRSAPQTVYWIATARH